MTGILLFSSPIYIYWGRTVMIESCALFFGLLMAGSSCPLSNTPLGHWPHRNRRCRFARRFGESNYFPRVHLLGGFWILAKLKNVPSPPRLWRALFKCLFTPLSRAPCHLP